MNLRELDYALPEGLIAQRPAEPRESARLLVVDRVRESFEEHRFGDLPGLAESAAGTG